MGLRIQSTYNPPERLSPADWELYIKVKSIRKMKMIRRINDKLNRILSQSIGNFKS